jgi:glycosyltransferase involved in cell wall biosynthesis
MRKILFIHSNLEIGGAEMMRYMLLRHIDRNRYDIKVCCLGKKGVLGERLEALGYEVKELNQDPDSLNAMITVKLFNFLRKERPDIVHSSLFNANFHGRLAALMSHVPYIITEEHGEHKQYNGLKFFPYLAADFMLSALNTYIVCCSEGLRADITKKEKLPLKKVVSIENCLDRGFYGVSIPREEIRKKHGICDEVVFIVVATLKTGKGHEYLLDALKGVKDAGLNFRCFLAGDGPLGGYLKQKCLRLGLSDQIEFLGSIGNIPDYLNASDVFILPSDSEGHSIALMEAMLMGLACIATDVGTNAALVKDGFNGTIVSVRDREELKEAVMFYINNRDLVKVFGARSRDLMEKRCSPEEYARRYHELWDKCAPAEK